MGVIPELSLGRISPPPKAARVAREYARRFSCAIFRLPGATANIVCREYAKTGKPFSVELVIDPWENFAPGSGTGILRPLIRRSWTSIVRKMCLKANGASYVTERYLQQKYPCAAMRGSEGRFTAYYSSVELPDDAFAQPRNYAPKETWIIAHTANSMVDYCKGHIQLMNAVKLVREQGYDVRIRFIGDGSRKEEFRQYAGSLGIGESVMFLGRLPSTEEVRRALAQADMFVFPTRAEGLPRGLLEAMAEGLPCISSPTCGIPEVLDEAYLSGYDDAERFAQLIIDFITNPDRMTAESERNLRRARDFAASLLTARRSEFYERTRDAAAAGY
ncbi:MAG: glycosyltransferase [Anaerotruncus rubiinfantis]|jgi:glycosyltransferase involved in cell wall biosynthesis